jgi:hypothetical protein
MLIITKKMQRNTIFVIAVKALRVSDGFTAHYQELKNCTHSILYLLSLVAAAAAAARVVQLAVAATKLNKYKMLCVQFLSS